MIDDPEQEDFGVDEVRNPAATNEDATTPNMIRSWSHANRISPEAMTNKPRPSKATETP